MVLWPLTFVWIWLPFDLDIMSSSCQRQVLYHTTLVVSTSNLGSWSSWFFFPPREKEPPSWDVCLPLQTMDDGNVKRISLWRCPDQAGNLSPLQQKVFCDLRYFQEPLGFVFPQNQRTWASLYTHMRLLHLSENTVIDIWVSKLQQRAPLVTSYRQTHQTCSHLSINSSQGKCKD